MTRSHSVALKQKMIERLTGKDVVSGRSFYWALVDTLGARYGVVEKQSILERAPYSGGVISGEFWLSARLASFA